MVYPNYSTRASILPPLSRHKTPEKQHPTKTEQSKIPNQHPQKKHLKAPPKTATRNPHNQPNQPNQPNHQNNVPADQTALDPPSPPSAAAHPDEASTPTALAPYHAVEHGPPRNDISTGTHLLNVEGGEIRIFRLGVHGVRGRGDMRRIRRGEGRNGDGVVRMGILVRGKYGNGIAKIP
jgi:hypothetical protein